ncbi:MAG: hypothetical protein AAF487_02975 [Bacteroidota bacterium]
MIKAYTFILCLFLYSSISAQFEINDSFGELDLSFRQNSRNSESANTNTDQDFELIEFRIHPKYGTFISKNSALGAGIGFEKQIGKVGSDVKVKTSDNYNLFGSVFFRPHKRISEKFAGFVNCEASFGIGKARLIPIDPISLEPFGGSNDRNVVNSSIGCSPGLIYFLSDRIAINSQFGFLGYTYQREKFTSNGGIENSNEDQSILFEFGMQNIQFGLNLYFSRRFKS